MYGDEMPKFEEKPNYLCNLKTKGFKVYARPCDTDSLTPFRWEWQKAEADPGDSYWEQFGVCSKEDLEFLEDTPKTFSERASESLKEQLKPLGDYMKEHFEKYNMYESALKSICLELGDLIGLKETQKIIVLFDSESGESSGWAIVESDTEELIPVIKKFKTIADLIEYGNEKRTQ